MSDHYEGLLSPVGAVSASAVKGRAKQQKGAKRRVIGLIDNSKPNVAFVLDAVEEALRASGHGNIVRVTKTRSAAPCADLAALAGNCDFVVNAVAD